MRRILFFSSLISLAMALVATAQAVTISRTEPRNFIVNDMNSGSVNIYLQNRLPGDINGYNIRNRVKVYARAEGNFQPVLSTGWTADMLAVELPVQQLVTRLGLVEVKVAVDGKDSPLFAIPVVAPPSQPPTISDVVIFPSDTSTNKQGETYVSVKFYATNLDAADHTAPMVDGHGLSIGRLNRDQGYVDAWMPSSYLDKTAVLHLQLSNRAGASKPFDKMIGELKLPPRMLKLRETPMVKSGDYKNATPDRTVGPRPQPVKVLPIR